MRREIWQAALGKPPALTRNLVELAIKLLEHGAIVGSRGVPHYTMSRMRGEKWITVEKTRVNGINMVKYEVTPLVGREALTAIVALARADERYDDLFAVKVGP